MFSFLIAFLVIFYVVISKVLFLTSLGGNDPFWLYNIFPHEFQTTWPHLIPDFFWATDHYKVNVFIDCVTSDISTVLVCSNCHIRTSQTKKLQERKDFQHWMFANLYIRHVLFHVIVPWFSFTHTSARRDEESKISWFLLNIPDPTQKILEVRQVVWEVDWFHSHLALLDPPFSSVGLKNVGFFFHLENWPG